MFLVCFVSHFKYKLQELELKFFISFLLHTDLSLIIDLVLFVSILKI